MSAVKQLHLDLQAGISHHMNDIVRMFKVPVKITVVVRTPTLEDGGVLMGNDDPDLVIAEIRKLAGPVSVVVPGIGEGAMPNVPE